MQSHHDTSGGRINALLLSKFQADSIIAKRAIEGYSDFIVANNGDILALIGPSCLLLKSFKCKRGSGKDRSNVRHSTIKDLTFACASSHIRDIITRVLKDNGVLVKVDVKKRTRSQTFKKMIQVKVVNLQAILQRWRKRQKQLKRILLLNQ